MKDERDCGCRVQGVEVGDGDETPESHASRDGWLVFALWILKWKEVHDTEMRARAQTS